MQLLGLQPVAVLLPGVVSAGGNAVPALALLSPIDSRVLLSPIDGRILLRAA